MNNLTKDELRKINNRSLVSYADIYTNIEEVTLEQIESFGLALSKREHHDAEAHEKLHAMGAIYRNNNKSILSNERISSACEACAKGTGSYTTFVSLKCHRDCYFCFNKNQGEYNFYLQNMKNVNGDLKSLVEQGVKLTHLALTGGEPLLHREETLSFFQLADELVPDVHTRLYTAGDLLDEEILQGLSEAHLNEIRFSIKMEDSAQKRKHILTKIALAKNYIPDVLVEMPVIPGTGEEMKALLLELNQLDVFGINLLEFCFPLGNAKAFKEKGFELKNPPYEVYYNFWYAGGLAVAESEKLCLELVQFAMERKLKLGVHYCSLENKFTGQIYQQNHDQVLDETYQFSRRDFYFKTAKVFGKDKVKVKKVLEKQHVPFTMNEDYDFLQFPIEAIPLLKNREVDIILSSNVVEMEEKEQVIREVKLERTTPEKFVLEEV